MTLAELRGWIDELTPDAVTASSTRAVLSRLVRPAPLHDLLSTVLACRSQLENVASASYVHFNHFDKIVLAEAPRTGVRLTLHIWSVSPRALQDPDPRIHSHRFDFSSAVVTGSLRAEMFTPGEGSTYKWYRYRPVAGTPVSVLQYRGAVGLRSVAEAPIRAGEAYSLDHRRIHRIVVPDEEVIATMVVRGPRRRNVSDVFSTAPRPRVSLQRPRRLQPDLLREKLHTLRVGAAG
jgi:hypothetical protein